MEIALLIKKWMPSLTLIEPLEWRNKLIDEVKTFKDNLENDI